MHLQILLLLFSVVTAALPAHAATPLPEYGWLRNSANLGTIDGLDLAALAPSEARLATLSAEGVGYVDILWRTTVHLHADGSRSESDTEVRRFLSTTGVEQGGNMSFYVAPQYETVTVEHAVVVNPDGTVTLDPATLQVVPLQQPPVFSDVRNVIVPFPSLRPGSIVVLSTDHHRTTPDFLRPWSITFPLGTGEPVERFEVIVTWDAGAAAPYWVSSDPAVGCVPDGEHRLVCHGGPIAALTLDPDFNDYYDIVPQLGITQGSGWKNLVANITAMVERQTAQGDMRALAARLTATAHTPRERVDAVYRFVADEIRNVGMEHASGAFVPRPPEATLRNRFGDCKDKVVLFLSLARASGLDAHAVLASTDRHEVANLLVPAGSYFNHMIACVRGVDSEDVCVDPTLPHVAAGELGMTLQGAVALDLLPDTAAPRQLPAGRFALHLDVESEMRLACDGSIQERLRRVYSGSAALNYRMNLEGRRPDDRQRWLEEEYRLSLRGPSREVHPTFTVTGLGAPLGQVIVQSETTFPAGSPPREIPGFKDSEPWLTGIATAMYSDNRHYRHRHVGFRYTSTLHFDLCNEVTPHFFGPDLDLRASFGSLQRSYERAQSGVIVHTTLEVPAATIPVDQLPRFNRFIERAVQQTGIWFSLGPAS